MKMPFDLRQSLQLLCGGVCALAATAAAAEPSTIFIVRHAERADAGGVAQTDPELSEAGRARAEALARALQDVKITAIYATEYRRTQETARPLAKALGIEPTIIPATESGKLIAQLHAATGNVLVIGHSNTVPEIMKALGISSPAALGENDYDNLFVVVRDPVPRVLQLHYR